MANIKSSKKRIEVARLRTIKNAAIRSNLRTTLKKFRSFVDQNKEQTGDALAEALRTIDKAVTKGILHKNTAARKKSRLQKLFNNTSAK